jgi:acyl dehydratase
VSGAQTDLPVWVFDDFSPGQPLGNFAITLDDAHLNNWTAIYGERKSSESVPAGMLVAAMMEAYLNAIQPRPPGNIHASQKLVFGRSAKAGDKVEAQVSCRSKERRRERGWVTFGVVLSVEGQDVLNGEIRTIWAR